MGDQGFYVYVYIDPRNLEEFYYGKGQGNRKNAHLLDRGDSEKARRLSLIEAAGLAPIIKVVAASLTEPEALLIEKTLIWKLGRTLTNKSSGHYAEKFRPHDTLHLSLPGFDFANNLYYINVGDGPHRCWEDCREFGFLSAGQGKRWSDQIRKLEVGDVVVAYLKGCGYVGVGKVVTTAVPIDKFLLRGEVLSTNYLRQPNIYEGAGNHEKCEYLAGIEWLSTVPRSQAKFKRKAGLFTTQLIRASLANQPETIKFVERELGLSIAELFGDASKISND